MKVLVACEESQAVTKELRTLGVEAYSCDIIECSGGHPEWHIMHDVLPLLDGNCSFVTSDGAIHIQIALDNYPDIIEHGDAFAVREDDWQPPQTRSEWLDELLGGAV